MKTLKITFATLLIAFTLTSCREQTEAEKMEEQAEELIENAEDAKIKDDKVKIESPDGSETKIKYDEDGNVEKIKTDDNS